MSEPAPAYVRRVFAAMQAAGLVPYADWCVFRYAQQSGTVILAHG